MGKYMRKSKMAGDVAVMDISQPALGVRTRAKTLALQRLEATKITLQNPELCYLQLRSRRLEKPLFNQSTCGKQNPDPKNPSQNPNPKSGSKQGLISENSGSDGSGSISSVSNEKEGFLGETQVVASSNEKEGVLGETQVVGSKGDEAGENCDLGSEASFGENNLEFEGRDRGTRESTPCSLIRDSNALSTPGSSTRPRPTNLSAANVRIWNSIQSCMPSAHEIEEFFAGAEQEQQRRFAEKYNFDVVKDLPLPGRYEWVKVQP